MSSKFVAAGATLEPLSQADEWAKAQKNIELSRKLQKSEKLGTQEGGKSLYEHLQEQRAVKQEAFEEATKLRNQFRPLNDSEAEFLAKVQENEQQKEMRIRSETTNQLKSFRKERAAAEQAELAQQLAISDIQPGSSLVTEDWTASKKRRKPPTDMNAGVSKAVKASSTSTSRGSLQNTASAANDLREASKPSAVTSTQDIDSPAPRRALPTATSTSALVVYNSDSDS